MTDGMCSGGCGAPATREALDMATRQPLGVLLCEPGARAFGLHHTRRIPVAAPRPVPSPSGDVIGNPGVDARPSVKEPTGALRANAPRPPSSRPRVGISSPARGRRPDRGAVVSPGSGRLGAGESR